MGSGSPIGPSWIMPAVNGALGVFLGTLGTQRPAGSPSTDLPPEDFGNVKRTDPPAAGDEPPAGERRQPESFSSGFRRRLDEMTDGIRDFFGQKLPAFIDDVRYAWNNPDAFREALGQEWDKLGDGVREKAENQRQFIEDFKNEIPRDDGTDKSKEQFADWLANGGKGLGRGFVRGLTDTTTSVLDGLADNADLVMPYTKPTDFRMGAALEEILDKEIPVDKDQYPRTLQATETVGELAGNAVSDSALNVVGAGVLGKSGSAAFGAFDDVLEHADDVKDAKRLLDGGKKADGIKLHESGQAEKGAKRLSEKEAQDDLSRRWNHGDKGIDPPTLKEDPNLSSHGAYNYSDHTLEVESYNRRTLAHEATHGNKSVDVAAFLKLKIEEMKDLASKTPEELALLEQYKKDYEKIDGKLREQVEEMLKKATADEKEKLLFEGAGAYSDRAASVAANQERERAEQGFMDALSRYSEGKSSYQDTYKQYEKFQEAEKRYLLSPEELDAFFEGAIASNDEEGARLLKYAENARREYDEAVAQFNDYIDTMELPPGVIEPSELGKNQSDTFKKLKEAEDAAKEHFLPGWL